MKTRKEGDCCVSPVKKKWGRNGGEGSFFEGSFFKMAKNNLGAVNEIEAIDLMARTRSRELPSSRHIYVRWRLYCTV